MRKRKLVYNTAASILNQLIAIICGFILPKLLLNYFGSAVNGLVASITQFLGFIAFLELGVGAVVQSTLYKPLAENDIDKISQIMKSAENYFRKIAIIFVFYTLVVMIVYPFTTLDSFDYLFTLSLVLIISISSFVQYYFGIANQLLLNADQTAYIPLLVQSATLIVNTIVSIILIRMGASIQIVKLSATLIFIVRPLILTACVKRRYDIDKNIVITEEPIKQKWNGLAQHMAAIVLDKTDVVVLTLFSSLLNVSVYSVYNIVVTGVKQVIMSFTTGVQALFGNMLAKNELEQLNKNFATFEWLMHTLVTLAFGCTIILITPFAMVYTSGITDANYNVPVFGSLIAMAQASYSIRLIYNIMVLAAGHYKQTQVSAVVEMLLNIIISVALVFRWGLEGVAVSTFIAMSYRAIYLAWYISKNILYREIKNFIYHILVDILSIVLIYSSTSHIKLNSATYFGWFIMALKVFGISSIIVIGINLIFYRKRMKESFKFIKRRIGNNKA